MTERDLSVRSRTVSPPARASRWLALVFLVVLGTASWVTTAGSPESPKDAAAVPSRGRDDGPQAAPAVDAAPSVPSLATRTWSRVPRVVGRLTSRDVGLVINTDDPYSVQVGQYYARARGLSEDQILKVSLPTRASLTPEEFARLASKVDEFYGDRVQALALAWRAPYAVKCNAITGALTMGYDAGLCADTCAASRPSRYFGSSSTRPYDDHRMRLSMLLAAPNVEAAKALIDRGVRADGTAGLRGAPPAHVHLVTTSDSVRSVRRHLFPPEGPVPLLGLEVHLDRTDAVKNASRVLMYLTGRVKVDHLDTVDFLPGALADHFTSFGGALDDSHGQMTALSWIQAGATASYGTVSEPCSHVQKFPHPQALILFYAQGASALEAYWKSVAWPQQGLFIGEPLAAPFDRGAAARATAAR